MMCYKKKNSAHIPDAENGNREGNEITKISMVGETFHLNDGGITMPVEKYSSSK